MTHTTKEHKNRMMNVLYRKIKPERTGLYKSPKIVKGIYPKFRIDLKNLPEARKWDIGGKYHLGLELEQTGINIDDYSNTAVFDVRGLKVMNENTKNVVKNLAKKYK